MKTDELIKRPTLREASELIDGTNCANCSFATDKRKATDEDELDAQNGVKVEEKDLDKAKVADFVTLPGKPSTVYVAKCSHPKIKFNVSSHNCCAYWDNPGCLRAFKQ